MNLVVAATRDRRENDRRLDTWKEIGAFFGRDERTVKRWEASRGLPVHRVPGSGRATVYAYVSELDRWLKSADVTIPDSAGTSAFPPVSGLHVASEMPLLSDSQLPDQTIPAADEALTVASASENTTGHTSANHRNAEPAPSQPFVLLSPANPIVGTQKLKPRYIAASFLLAVAVAALVLGAAGYHLPSRQNSAVVPAEKHTPNPEAQEFFLKGEYYLQKRTPESLNQAVDNYTQAIVRDPGYAEAYVGLADCYNLLREYTVMPASEAYPRALAAAKEAIALDDSLSGAHAAVAFVDFYWLWDAPAAEREFRRAIALDPNSISAHHWYATFLYHLGRFDEALAEINHAQRLDPSSISVLADRGLILFCAGHSEQAIALLKQMETAEPTFLSPRAYLAGIYLNTGNYLDYLTEAEQAALLIHDQDRLSIVQAASKGFNRAGPDGMLQAILARQMLLLPTGKVSHFAVAVTSARLGRQQEALEYLRIACAKHEPDVSGMAVDPAFRSLHRNPEYRKLLTQAGLPQPQPLTPNP